MKYLFRVLGIGMCLLLATSFASAGNARGRRNGPEHVYQRTQRNINQQTQQNRNRRMWRDTAGNSHHGINENGWSGHRRQMHERQEASRPNGACLGTRNGSGPKNGSGTFRPNYTDANHDGICDNAPTR